jgi:hypothetical protein
MFKKNKTCVKFIHKIRYSPGTTLILKIKILRFIQKKYIRT